MIFYSPDEGKVFPYTDWPRPVNNMFIIIIIFFSVFLDFNMIEVNRFANSLRALRGTVTLWLNFAYRESRA